MDDGWHFVESTNYRLLEGETSYPPTLPCGPSTNLARTATEDENAESLRAGRGGPLITAGLFSDVTKLRNAMQLRLRL